VYIRKVQITVLTLTYLNNLLAYHQIVKELITYNLFNK